MRILKMDVLLIIVLQLLPSAGRGERYSAENLRRVSLGLNGTGLRHAYNQVIGQMECGGELVQFYF